MGWGVQARLHRSTGRRRPGFECRHRPFDASDGADHRSPPDHLQDQPTKNDTTVYDKNIDRVKIIYNLAINVGWL